MTFYSKETWLCFLFFSFSLILLLKNFNDNQTNVWSLNRFIDMRNCSLTLSWNKWKLACPDICIPEPIFFRFSQHSLNCFIDVTYCILYSNLIKISANLLIWSVDNIIEIITVLLSDHSLVQQLSQNLLPCSIYFWIIRKEKGLTWKENRTTERIL